MTEAAEVDAGLRQSREQTVLAHLEAENRQDVGATLATFKPGAARTELPGEVADGPDAVAANYSELFAALPDLHFEFRPGSLCHHGDRVMIETRFHGTHRGSFRGLPPTGRRVDVPMLLIFQFDGPDLINERVYYDRLSLFIQLGVAREPNTLTGRIMTLFNHPVTVGRAALRPRRIGNS
jgi:predicted ester cyclase